jgi:hypothetical protein
MFTYVASGGILLSRCGINWQFRPLYIHPTAFDVGDKAWLKYKAQKGKLVSVVIKKIVVHPFLYEGRGNCTAIYFDTLNAAYNEDDLITNAEAVAIAVAFLERELLQAEGACVT